MQAQKILHFYPNLFISLTYIPVLASGSNEAKQEEENVSAAKKLKLDTTGQPGTSGVSSTSKTRKIKGKDKRKITFSVDKISLQTWRNFNLSPKIVFFVMNCYWLAISYTPTSCHNVTQLWSVLFNILYLIIWVMWNERDLCSNEHCLRGSENMAWKKFRPVWIWAHDLCDTIAVLYQLS